MYDIFTHKHFAFFTLSLHTFTFLHSYTFTFLHLHFLHSYTCFAVYKKYSKHCKNIGQHSTLLASLGDACISLLSQPSPHCCHCCSPSLMGMIYEGWFPPGPHLDYWTPHHPNRTRGRLRQAPTSDFLVFLCKSLQPVKLSREINLALLRVKEHCLAQLFSSLSGLLPAPALFHWRPSSDSKE